MCTLPKFIDMPEYLNNIKTDTCYTLGTFKIFIASDSDAWVSAGEHNHSPTYRYRAYHGGSDSPNTHNALVLLAYAIHLHNNQDLIKEEIKMTGGKILSSEFDEELTKKIEELRRISRVHDDHDGYHIGHLRISFTKDHVSAYTPPSFLGSLNYKGYSDTFKYIFGRNNRKLKRFIFKRDSTLANKIVWNAFRLLALAMHMDDERRPQPTFLEIRRIP